MMHQNTSENLSLNNTKPLKKEQRLPGSLDYLEFIRKQIYCCICLKTTPVEPHHLKAIGMGNNRKKENERHYTAIPVCRTCHREYHDKGEKFQVDKYKMNHWKELSQYIRKYLCK